MTQLIDLPKIRDMQTRLRQMHKLIERMNNWMVLHRASCEWVEDDICQCGLLELKANAIWALKEDKP